MKTEKRVRVIVNPTAHSGRAWRTLERAGLLDGDPPGVRVEWIESRSAAHLGELVRVAQDDDLDALGLAGGDGTVTLALAGLDDLRDAGGKARANRVPIGILPVGSGNDFAR